VPAFAAVTLLIAAWVGLGGADRLIAPITRWKLPNGDTIEVLTYTNWYEASYSLTGKTVKGEHYLWLQFRSDFTDPARDRRDVLAVAQILCPLADSAGVGRIKIEPARTRFLGLVTYKRSHWFDAGSGGRCGEVGEAR
jgi:hypothetical protein